MKTPILLNSVENLVRSGHTAGESNKESQERTIGLLSKVTAGDYGGWIRLKTDGATKGGNRKRGVPIKQRDGPACMGDRTNLSATINGTADFANTYAYGADQNLTGAYSYGNDARSTGVAYTANAGQTTIDALGWGYDAASGGHQPANEAFSFDANGMLTKHVRYIYDVFDNLISEQDDDTGGGSYGHQEFYVVGASPQTPTAGQPPAESAQPLLQFDVSGALVERYLVAPNPAGRDAVLAQGAVSSPTQGDVVTWMADDDQGATRDVADDSGTEANHIVFAAFGGIAFESNPASSSWAGFGGGHVSAATGFENDDERWLDPGDGDWLNQDPSGFGGGDANLSRYVGNSPADAIDPTGDISLGQAGAMAVTPMFLWPLIMAAQSEKESTAQQDGAAAQQAAANAAGQQQWQAQQAANQHMYDAWLDNATNYFGGYANAVTLGHYEEWIGDNAVFINKNSGFYAAGQYTGYAWWAATAAAAAQAGMALYAQRQAAAEAAELASQFQSAQAYL